MRRISAGAGDAITLPLLYVLGARGEDEEAQVFTDAIELGSVSMMGVGFGIGDAIPGVGLATPAS